MSTSHFSFLTAEFSDIYTHALKAEQLARSDARTACFYARIALETAVNWMYRHDRALRLPSYDTTLSSLIHEPTFRTVAGNAIVTKAKIIKDLGNNAAHDGKKTIAPNDAITAVRELFHIAYWLVRTYAKGQKPPATLAFIPDALPHTTHIPTAKLKQIEAQFEAQQQAAAKAEIERRKSEEDSKALDAEIKKLQEEIARVKQVNTAAPDNHDYNEAETRDAFIDLLLKEAGWPLNDPRDREFQVSGMPNNQGKGFVDDVLWGQDGKPLGLVEAKRTRRDPREGQRQAELYADALEQQFGQRPIIFYTNGYEHWLWDDTRYPPRPVQGFLKRDELELLIHRRTSLKKLGAQSLNQEIAGRYYQTRAIRRVAETFEKDRARKALLVMATGSGKTRTVIALCDMMMRANWAKRILFLADRVALVNQAAGAFKKFLPHASPVNLITDKSAQGRVYVSTYPTMMGLINEVKNGGVRPFGAGHFDLIIIDEAHRSVYRKYRAIFEYFDSLLVGLTATPKDEVDRDTYDLFDLQRGVPTDAYDLDEAVNDGFLVPPKTISVPLKFQREGIKYDDLSEEEKEQWDALEWDENGTIPDYVYPAELNTSLFNKDTFDKVLAHLMTHGLHVDEGDKLGKTIIFAKNREHAQCIEDRFNANYPHLHGKFARVIDFKTEYPQSLIDDFSEGLKLPQIAISVDMLDTGIDVPEVVNLVFFKIVRSKTKFWQMIGRGTRLCPDLFGVGRHKTHFVVFDYCQNFEFFNQNPELADGAASASLSQRLFMARVDILEKLNSVSDESLTALAEETAQHLKKEVGGMNLDNFVVRPKRKCVEKYQEEATWQKLGMAEYLELKEHLSDLPTAFKDDDVAAKQFDLLLFKCQLSLLNSEKSFLTYKKKIVQIAASLEELQNVPMVAAQMELILDIQSDEYWKDITPVMLDTIRKRLRSLLKLVDSKKRPHIFTNFEDELGDHAEVPLNIVTVGTDMERFKAKVRHFLKDHLNHIAIQKIRLNQPLTPTDIAEIESMFLQSGIATPDEIARLRQEARLGVFIRSLVGLDREAAKAVFAEFQKDKNLTADQLEFLNMIINHLTERGVMEPRLLYESPFTDFNDMGIEGVFASAEVIQLIGLLEDVEKRAAA
jgi:type I restriction enzyme R subunit